MRWTATPADPPQDTSPSDASDVDAEDAEVDHDADTGGTDVEDTDGCLPGVERNACGGCEPLQGELGALCGCDEGLWTCDGAERMTCLDDRGRPILYDGDQDGWGALDPAPPDVCTVRNTPARQGIDCDDDDAYNHPGQFHRVTRSDFTLRLS